MNKSTKNTKNKGRVRILVFKERAVWYGVALEFNIVESGDDPKKVLLSLEQAIRGYVKAAKKAKLGSSVLNQKTEKEYEDIWNQVQTNNLIRSPYQIHSANSLILQEL